MVCIENLGYTTPECGRQKTLLKHSPGMPATQENDGETGHMPRFPQHFLPSLECGRIQEREEYWGRHTRPGESVCRLLQNDLSGGGFCRFIGPGSNATFSAPLRAAWAIITNDQPLNIISIPNSIPITHKALVGNWLPR